jgi:soluble lytic murein transglycosylase
MRWRIRVAAGICLLVGQVCLGAQNPQLIFSRADADLQAGRDVDVGAVIERLGDYPIAPYLRYRELLLRLDSATAEEILAFARLYPQLPVVSVLQTRWLYQAGADGDWHGFRRVDSGQGGATLECYRLQAERALGAVSADWIERARGLWTVGRSQPRACDPVFEVLYQRDALSPERRWRRVELLMAAGQTGVAASLRSRLEPAQRVRLEMWIAAIATPQEVLSRPEFALDTEWGRTVAVDGFQQLARTDPGQALALIRLYRERRWLDTAILDELQRYTALQAAYSRHPQALRWLDALPAPAIDATVREWTARVALGEQNWPRLREAVATLPEVLRNTPEWTYWRAVALAHTGDIDAARTLLLPLSGQRQYYGFLAADLLGRSYAMNHRPVPRDQEGIRELAQRPGIVRARELFQVGLHEAARREWYTALAGADRDTWRDAAHLALDWGWYGRTVHAANRAGLHDAVDLRFPLAFRDQIVDQARQAGLDPALVYALIRKESAFEPTAVSRVGARGLMQIMPATAGQVARRVDAPPPVNGRLLSPEYNLRLGTAYLRRMLARFNGSLIMAAAAYNAGPTRTEGWQQDNAGLPGPIQVENITYGETRDYVKSVLAFRAVFDWQLHGEARRLTAAMGEAPLLAGLQ